MLNYMQHRGSTVHCMARLCDLCACTKMCVVGTHVNPLTTGKEVLTLTPGGPGGPSRPGGPSGP